MKKEKFHRFHFLGIEHLKENNMRYIHHCRHGLVNAGKLLILSVSSIIHSFFPMILKYHAAKGVIAIYEDMKKFAHLHKLLNNTAFNNDKDKSDEQL
jgi:hypothetical protein